MNCQNHLNKESVATCVVCGKSICRECRLNIAGKSYCQECVTEIVATEAPKRTKSQKSLKNESNKGIEEKYEKYLDDLYYKENKVANDKNNNNISLKEQLARDEAEYGSIVREPRKPAGLTQTEEFPQTDVDRSNLRSINLNDENKKNRLSLHPHIHSGQKKKKIVEEESTTTEIVLTIILIIMIILTASYIIYLFTLATSYPSFFDAVYALFNDPAELINNIFS